jgi:hypothetical protein
MKERFPQHREMAHASHIAYSNQSKGLMSLYYRDRRRGSKRQAWNACAREPGKTKWVGKKKKKRNKNI